MSWAADEWKDGLPQKALVKIGQIEAQLEKLKKERDQKQFQLESLEQALEVQKRKGSNEKSEVVQLQRENQSLKETCQDLETKKQKLASDLSTKENQVTRLEQKLAELGHQQNSEKKMDAVGSQVDTSSDLQSQLISSLQQEIVELQKQLEGRSNIPSCTPRKGGRSPSTSQRILAQPVQHVVEEEAEKWEETSSVRSLRHPSEGDELRKTQQELRVLQALVAELEQKNKKLIQDGECVRHNAEAARQHLETRMKEHEKELKQDVAQALESARNAERVLQESKLKWQQEINAVQAEQNKQKGLLEKAEADKACLVREQDEMAKKVAMADGIIKASKNEVVEAEKKKAGLEVEKQKLVSELDQKGREIQAQAAEILKLKNDIGLREQANVNLKEQVNERILEQERIRAEADRMAQKLLQAENQWMDLQRQKDKVDVTVKELSELLNKSQSDKENLEKSNAELVGSLQKMQSETVTLSESLQDVRDQMSQEQSNFRESQRKWQETETKLREELAQKTTHLTELNDQKLHAENQLLSKEKEILELVSCCKASELSSQTKDEEIMQKAQDIGGLEKQLQALQEKHRALTEELHQQKTFATEKVAQMDAILKSKTEELEGIATESSQEKVRFEAEVDKLVNQKQALELDVSTYRAQCVSLDSLTSGLREENKTLRTELDMKASTVTDMSSVLENLKRDLQEKMEENAAWAIKVNQRDQHIHSVEDSLAAKEKEIERVQEELGAAGDKNEKLEREKMALVSELDECKKLNVFGQELKDSYENQIRDLQKQFEKSQEECLSMSSQLNSEREKGNHLETRVASLHGNCCDLETRITAYKKELEDKATACSKLEEQCSQVSQLVEALRAENKICSDQCLFLESQLKESKEDHQKTVQEMSEKLQEAVECGEQTKGMLEAKDDRVMELDKEIVRLKNGIVDLEAAHASVKVELESRASEMLTLEEKCASCSDELAEAKLKLSAKEQLLSSHTENISQLESRVKELEEEKTTLEMSLGTEMDRLNELVLQQEKKLSQQVSRITEAEDHARDLSTKLSETLKQASESHESYVQETETLKSKLEMLQMDVDDTDGVVQDLNVKVSNLNVLLENVTRERDSLKEASQMMNMELGELKSALEVEKVCLAEARHEQDVLNAKNANLEASLVSLQTQLEEKNAVLKEIEVSYENAQRSIKESEIQLKECEAQKDTFFTRIRDLEHSVTEQKEMVHSKTAELESISEKCSLLSENLEEITLELSEKTGELSLRTQSHQAMEFKLKELESFSSQYEERTHKELEELRHVVLQRQEALDQMMSSRDELVGCGEDLKIKLSEAERLKSEQDQYLSGLRSQMEVLQMDIEDKDQTVLELQAKISDLENKLNNLTQESMKAERTEKSLEAEMLELRTALEMERKMLNDAMMIENTLNDRIKNLESALSEVRSRHEEAETKLRDVQVECENLRTSNTQFEADVQEFQQDRDRLCAVISSLQDASSSDKQLMESKTSELISLKERCISLSEELELTKTEVIQKQEEVSTKAQEILQLEQTINKLEQEKQAVEGHLHREIDSLQAKLAGTEEALKGESSRIVDLENLNRDMRAKLSGLTDKQFEDIAHHNEETSALKSELDMLQLDLKLKEDTMQELNTQVFGLNSTIKNLTDEKSNLEEMYQSSRTELTLLRADLETEKESCVDTKKTVGNQKDRIDSLETSVAEVRALLSEKEKQFSDLKLEFERAAKESSDKQKQIIEYEQELQKSALHISDIEEKLSSLQEIVLIKTSEMATVSSDSSDLQEKLIIANKELLEKQEDLHRMCQTLQSLEAKVEQLEVSKKFSEEALNKDVSELEKLLSQKTSDLLQKSSELEEAELKLSDLQGKFSEAVAKKLDGERESAVLLSQLDDLKNSIKQKDEMLDAVTNEASDLVSVNNEYDKLRATTALLESEHSQLQESHELLKVEHSKQLTEIHTLQKAVSDLEDKLAELTDSLQSKELQTVNIEHQLKEMMDNSEKLKTSTSEKQDHIRSLEATIKDLENQLRSVSKEKNDLDRCSSQNIQNLHLQLSSVKEDLEAKSHEFAHLKTMYDNLNTSLGKSMSKLAEVEIEKTEACESTEELRRLYNEAKSDLYQRENTVQVLREELENATLENDVLRTDKGEWQAKEEKYKQDIHDLEIKLSDLEVEIESTRESFESVSVQRFEAQSKLHSVLVEKKALENKLKDMEAELENARIFSESSHSQAVESENLRKELSARDKEISELKTQLERVSKSHESDVCELDLLREQKEELERAVCEVRERNQNLEDQLNDFMEATKDMKEQLAQLQDLIHTLNKSVDSKKKEIVQRVNELSEKGNEISRLESAIKEKELLNAEISQQIIDVKKETSSTIGTLQDAIESLNFELSAAEEEKTSLISDNSVLKSENVELQGKITDLKIEVENLQKAQTSDARNLKNQVSELEKTKADLAEQVVSLEKSSEELKVLLEEKIKHTSDLSLQAKSLSEQLKDKSAQCEGLSVQIETLKAEVSSSQKELQGKEAELCHRKEAEEGLNLQVSELVCQRASLEHDLDCKKDEINKLKDQNEDIILKYEKLQNENVNVTEEFYKVKAEKIVLENRIEELEIVTADRGQLEQKVRDFDIAVIEKDQLKARIQSLEFAEAEKLKLEAKLQKLEQESDTLKEKVLQLGKDLASKEKLDQKVKDLELMRASLQEKIKKLDYDNGQLQNNLMEVNQQLEVLRLEKSSMEEKLMKLDVDNCHLGDKVKDRDQKLENVKLEKAAYEERLVKLESDNLNLESNMKGLEKNLETHKLEKASLEEQITKLKHDSCDLVSKLKEMEAAVSAYDIVREKVDMLERTLAEKVQELNQARMDKENLEKRLDELQNEHNLLLQSQGSEENNEKKNELLRKWEQRCSQLSAQMAMDRKKIHRLTEQVEQLKASKVVENVEDAAALKVELEEVKKERDLFKEKYIETSDAGERHFIRANKFQRLNEKLNSRNKLLNALMKGEKIQSFTLQSGSLEHGVSKIHNEQIMESIAETAKNIQETSSLVLPDKAKEHETHCSKVGNSQVLFDQTLQKKEVSASDMDMVKSGENSNLSSSCLKQKTSVSFLQKDADVSLPFNPAIATKPYPCRFSPRQRVQSPKVQSAQKPQITTSKPNVSLEAVQSPLKNKALIPSKTTLQSNTQAPMEDAVIMKPSFTVHPAPSTAASSHALSRVTQGAKMIASGHQTTDATDKSSIMLSPRVTRRMSQQKRLSTDHSTETAGGKKPKLADTDTAAEATSVIESRSSMQQRKLPRPIQLKPTLTSGLPRPLTRRTKQEMLISGGALTTITNSPKKIDSLDAKSRRMSRISARKIKSPVKQVAGDEGSECKVQ